jgi:CDP-diacylglycerol--serine O-phosphatidyltransferase
MQDDAKETTNNMQADINDAPEAKASPKEFEPVISPGPSVLNWRKVAPNSITVMATMVGLTSVYFAMEKRFEFAVIAVLAAGVLDGLDGPVARALHGTSRFGAELDSLSDYVNFGVSPGMVMYLWSGYQWGWMGWVVSLIYTVCMGCRLARFNAGVDFNASPVTRNFFMGVPAPAGGALVAFPLVCTFEFGEKIFSTGYNFNDPRITMPFTLIVAFLLVSRVPTFSSKMINRTVLGKINAIKIVALLVFLGAIITTLVLNPWSFLIGFCAVYIISFPVSYATFKVWTNAERKNKSA